MPIKSGDPLRAAIIVFGWFEEITPRPYEPSSFFNAFWVASNKELDDWIAKSIACAITSVSVSEANS